MLCFGSFPNSMIQPTIEILPLKKGFLRAAADATYALVRIVAPEAPATTESVVRTPLDIALVIDRSGSMSGQPLETAKECAVRIVKGLRPDDRISIVTFDKHAFVRFILEARLIYLAAGKRAQNS
ncbi:VWA domain-containing protein [bacterium]|nr:VWA domain-containing protein [bacterium]